MKTPMKPRVLSVLVLAASLAHAQSLSPTVYAESFRKGATHVTEEKFEARLTPANSNYRERIKDVAGNDRYELNIAPQGPSGDNKVTAWRIQLRDLHHAIYNNLLLEDQEPSQDPKNNLWWLNPTQLELVPIRARRVVKVDGFYVVFQVKDFHFTPLDSPYLDSMVVQFELTNSDPRSGH
jgi:hypothetical protein